MSAPASVLAMDGVSKSFGGLDILRDVTLNVLQGVSTALIGPNGAGKTTLFNVISGVYSVDRGRIAVNGWDVTALPSRQRIDARLGRSFQNVRLMSHLTVLENLFVGQHVRAKGLINLLVPFKGRRNHPWREQAMNALAECGLEKWADETVSVLPYGVRKRIDLIRATLTDPLLLLLDEPAAGLNATESQDLCRHLDLIKARGVTLLVIEHDMHFVGAVCDHVAVLDYGELIAEGSLADIRSNRRVREAYLGAEADT